MEGLRRKESALQEFIANCGSALVAFSGGVDSLLLAYLAGKVLGERSLAVTAASPIRSKRNAERAKRLAQRLKIRHLVVRTEELTLPGLVRNGRDRCYHCKDHLLQKLNILAAEHGLKYIFDGSNRDDLKEYRPGLRALRKWKVVSPFLRCGIGKEEIRLMARRFGLPGWNRPADTCLITRVPYGVPLTRALITRIERAEDRLAELGFDGFRVRHHGQVARIEIDPRKFSRALRMRQEIVGGLRAAGYRFVALDLEGYRMGCFDKKGQ